MKIRKKTLLSPKTFNILYSIGASIVILGALFKLLHVTGADTILILGMGTEAIIFFISAFDEPSREPNWEKVYPGIYDDKALTEEEKAELTEMNKTRMQGNVGGGGTVIVGDLSGLSHVAGAAGTPDASGAPVVVGGVSESVTPSVISVGASSTQSVDPVQTDAVALATNQYVEQLNAINESLAKVQVALSGMSENGSYAQQMEVLGKSIQSMNAMYELQLRSLSSQMGTIEEVRLERDQLANNLKQMNEVYARMLQAMTVNMNVAPKA